MPVLLRSLPALLLAGLAGCGRESTDPAPGMTAAEGASPPSQLGLCASCHGRNGIAVIADTPDLAGRDRDELLAAMQAYLDGSREHGPMRAMLGPIRASERERLADWYAAQPTPDSMP